MPGSCQDLKYCFGSVDKHASTKGSSAVCAYDRASLAIPAGVFFNRVRRMGHCVSDVTDAGVTDAGVTDAGVADAGVTDAGVTDAGVTDAGVDNDAGVNNADSTQAPAQGTDADPVRSQQDAGTGP